MANTLLTPTKVLREALRVAHEKCTFIGTIQRQYDDNFANEGGKIGSTLTIRQPNQYTVRTGKTLNSQDTTETSSVLTVATQKGVDISFSSAELAMDIEDFSKRYIEPAMSVLISTLDSDAITAMSKTVYNHVGTPGTQPTFKQIALAKAKLNQNLAPKNMKERHIQLESIDMAGVNDDLKALFHDSKQIAKQYREGAVGSALGLNWTENERVYTHTNGADVAGDIDDTPAEGDSILTISLMSAAPAVGSVFTIAGVKAVHPETKVAYAHEQQFVVSNASTPTTTEMSFTPPLRASGARQNIDHLPSDADVITFVGSASTAYPNHIAYHSEAFAWASADLPLPDGVDFAHREVMDGISARIIRQYDINNDQFPCRIDILHGVKELRPEWACRLMGKGS